MTTTLSFLGQKIKWGVILYEKIYQTSWLYNINIKQILNANLWSIYSKRFEFMVYTFICVFWKIKIFRLLRPSKKTQFLEFLLLSMPFSKYLTCIYCTKTGLVEPLFILKVSNFERTMAETLSKLLWFYGRFKDTKMSFRIYSVDSIKLHLAFHGLFFLDIQYF